MDLGVLFDLLEFPVTPLPNGDIAVWRDASSAVRVNLRGNGTVAKDAGIAGTGWPWLLTETHLLILSEHGTRELAFDVGRFGPAAGSRDFYPAVVWPESRQSAQVFVLNTYAGARLLALDGGKLSDLHAEGLPYLFTTGWPDDKGLTLAGMATRTKAWHDLHSQEEYTFGRPVIVRIDPGLRDWREVPFPDPLSCIVGRERLLRAMPKRLSAPEAQLPALRGESWAASGAQDGGRVLLLGITSAGAWDDALDTPARAPMNEEIVGVAVVRFEDWTLLSIDLSRRLLGSVRMGECTLFYFRPSQADAASAEGLICMRSDAAEANSSVRLPVEGEPVTFRVRHYPPHGLFAVAGMRSSGGRTAAFLLRSVDGVNWTSLGSEQTLNVIDTV